MYFDAVDPERSRGTQCKQKGFAPILVLVGILVITAAFGGVYYFGKSQLAKSQNSLVSQTPQPLLIPSSAPDKIANPDPIKSDPDSIGANWQIYQNRELKYEFRYPSDWSETQGEFGSKSPFSIQRFRDDKLWIIITGYISKAQLSTMGITYCGVYPEDKARCENKTINGNLRVKIDWGTEIDHKAYAHVVRPDGGIVTLTLEPVIPETKSILNKILSTFRFTN